jgi:hypothetical protein
MKVTGKSSATSLFREAVRAPITRGAQEQATNGQTIRQTAKTKDRGPNAFCNDAEHQGLEVVLMLLGCF